MIHDKNQDFISDKMTNEPVVIAEIEEMEDRIAPGWLNNHNETLVADDLDSIQDVGEIEEMEDRIAPGWMNNHNETLVRDAE